MNLKKNMFLPFLITLFLSLSGCFVFDTVHAAKDKIVEETKKVRGKSKVSSPKSSKPNIVIVITDDQGYGDLGCTGNPIIKTPHTDKLANESVWLTDYHVAPTCSPTRAALMSGHWTNRTGVWHTIMGRSMLRANEGTLGQFFKENGYETGMFGKWHLGIIFLIGQKTEDLPKCTAMVAEELGRHPMSGTMLILTAGIFITVRSLMQKGFARMYSLRKATVLFAKV